MPFNRKLRRIHATIHLRQGGLILHAFAASTRSRPGDRLSDLVALRQQTIVGVNGAHIRLPNHIIARLIVNTTLEADTSTKQPTLLEPSYLTSVVKSIESPTPKLDAAGVNESATLDHRNPAPRFSSPWSGTALPYGKSHTRPHDESHDSPRQSPSTGSTGKTPEKKSALSQRCRRRCDGDEISPAVFSNVSCRISRTSSVP